jgi:hypothetical protein
LPALAHAIEDLMRSPRAGERSARPVRRGFAPSSASSGTSTGSPGNSVSRLTPAAMRIAFYAPLKAPGQGFAPSGDRRVAGLLMAALGHGGQRVELVSTFRSYDADGDRERQAALRAQGESLGRSLAAQWQALPRPSARTSGSPTTSTTRRPTGSVRWSRRRWASPT